MSVIPSRHSSAPATRPVIGRRSLLLGAAASATLAGCSFPTSRADKKPTGVLRYQGWTNQVTLPELAEDLGYFNRVELKWVGNTISGPQDIQSAATGQIEFGGAFSGAIVKLAQSGVPIKAVIAYYGSDPKSFYGLYAQKDSPIRDQKTLQGAKIGVNTLGAHHEALIDTYLRQAGYTISDVQLVALPPTDIEESVRRGRLDAGILSGVFSDHAEAAQDLKRVFRDSDFLGSYIGGHLVFRDNYLQSNADDVRDFVASTGKAIEWARSTPREEVIERFTKIITDRKRPAETTENVKYWKSVSVSSKAGRASDKDFSQWSAWLRHTGAIKGDIDWKSLYTNQFQAS